MLLDITKAAINAVTNGIARLLHPDKPRDWFQNVHLPIDYSAEEVTAKLDQAAKTNPQFRNWKVSWVDLLKLSNPDNPDEAAGEPNRATLYDLFDGREHFGEPYRGSEKQNIWCHKQTFKAIMQRGIAMPEA